MEHSVDDEWEMVTVQYMELLSIFSTSFCVCRLEQSSRLPLFWLPHSHPYSLFHPVIPGLVVRPSGRLRGILGESALGRLCGHRACHFPQPALNAAEPWPRQDLALQIYVKPNSWSQTLFTSRLSIGGEKSLTHLNCGQCPPFVCWSSRVGRLAATSQDKTSEEPIQHVIWPPGSIADSQGSNTWNLWGFPWWSFSSIEMYPFDKNQNDKRILGGFLDGKKS